MVMLRSRSIIEDVVAGNEVVVRCRCLVANQNAAGIGVQSKLLAIVEKATPIK